MKSKAGNSKEVTSRQNAKFKLWLSLLEAKGIKKEGLCLVSGEKLIREIQKESSTQVVEWILPPKAAAPSPELPSTRLPADLFRELDVIGTHAPLAVAESKALSKWTNTRPKGLEVVLALSDPSNLGALIRSCEAFGANKVILTRECASPYLPRSIRASTGSVFRMPLELGPSIQELQVEHGFGLHMQGQDIQRIEWPLDMSLVLGEEGQGLPETLKLTRVRIPMNPAVESLNAMAAASIALFCYRSRFPLVR